MSTLNQLIERRRASDATPPQACHSIDAQPACLIVATPGGESWVFPWSHLAAAHLRPTEARDELRLVFTHYEVLLRGLHLGPLRDLVATLRLAAVRPAPTKYTKNAGDEPFIESVTISPLAMKSAREST